jgi:hypothetical protein
MPLLRRRSAIGERGDLGFVIFMIWLQKAPHAWQYADASALIEGVFPEVASGFQT